MRSIEQVAKDREPNIFRKLLTYDWIFSTPLEKMILTIVYAYAFYNLVRMIL